ncbi:MAG: hypothetical protein IH598_11280 [Bacteroidales bacterium]|nr:hypothetical protein [Bacteroidales bacterium]
MKKKILLIVLFSAFYVLMLGGNTVINFQNTDDILSDDVPPISSVTGCNDTTRCMRDTVLHKFSSTEKAEPAEEIPPVIIPQCKAENDTLNIRTKSLDLSKLGSVEYLVKWINLLLKMT